MDAPRLPPRRTQAQRREESDARLMTAAARIIASEGYLACTLERVGERAGFSRGLASRKYGSKDGLIEAVIWRVSAHVHEQVDEAIAGIDSPLQQLLCLVDRFVALVHSDVMVRAYFVLFSAMIANRLDTHEVFRQVQERFGERMVELIAAAQARGETGGDVSPESAAYLLGSLLAGMAIEAAMGAEPPSPALRPDLQRIMLRALAG